MLSIHFQFVLKDLTGLIDTIVQHSDQRKLLEYILLPRSTKFMHPKEVRVLQQGDVVRTS